MSTNSGEPEQTDANGKPETDKCEPACGCGATGLSKKGRTMVCLVVGLAAAAVLARGVMKRTSPEDVGDQQSFATALPVAGPEGSASSESGTPEAAGKGDTRSALWGKPLDSLASLNKAASDKDAVFVLLPSGSDEEINAIRAQMEAAAVKIEGRGTTMAAFTLDKNAQDYAQVSSQVPVPCVLTMVKGGGMSVVSKDITEANLLQAVVTASRPSSCGTAPASSCCP